MEKLRYADRPYMTHGYYQARHNYKSIVIKCYCGLTVTGLNVRSADNQLQEHIQRVREFHSAKSNSEETTAVQG